jgi:hypothetical protein
MKVEQKRKKKKIKHAQTIYFNKVQNGQTYFNAFWRSSIILYSA